ncbi:MAG: biotin--[acetyl-CoA-carboxylase] ligase [Lachnospiraceae bacterium]|nr:biotin--[acetyl-CoA-carboxylase] ligase [Lachnospiraceae bacterium]
MSVKSEMLKLLEANRGLGLSGQEIADRLGVTRAAVWKAVKSLEHEGYKVEAANNRGYQLSVDSDVLSAEGISPGLREKYRDYEIHVCKCVDSTNQEIKRRALEGAPHGLAVLAEEQTAGKGRRGRGFVSPPGTGIYMSVLFRPAPEQSRDVILITTAASVAVCRGIRRVLGEEPEIKWVNDVYLRGKKICGILTEAVSDVESGRIDTVVVGIGINYREPPGGFPEPLRELVGALCPETPSDGGCPPPRNELAAAVLNELFALYDDLPDKTFLTDYRQWSNVLGKEVRFTSPEARPDSSEEWEYGVAVDIDDKGGLIVEKGDGTRQILNTGEITLRVNENKAARRQA